MSSASETQSPCQSIVNLFVEPVYTYSTVEADLGYADGSGKFTKSVPKAHFQAIKCLLESATWTAQDEDWRVRVSYEIGDGTPEPVSLYYVDDPQTVKCCKFSTIHPVLWYCGEPNINTMVSISKEVKVQPPQPGTRYERMCIKRFKTFARKSSAAPGISWDYRLSVSWEGACVKDAYSSSPRYEVNVTMKRDQSERGYIAATNHAMQMSLAMNMQGKVEDMLKAGEEMRQAVKVVPIAGYAFKP
jgi:hypothetical protein